MIESTDSSTAQALDLQAVLWAQESGSAGAGMPLN